MKEKAPKKGKVTPKTKQIEQGKTNNPSTAIPILANVVDTYTDMYTYKQRPISPQTIERMAIEYIQFVANDPKVLMPSQWYTTKGMSKSAFYHLMERHPKLREAHEFVMMIIGDRRELGGLHGELNAALVAFTMPYYNKECWEKLHEWKAKLQDPDQQSTGPKFVVIEKMPDSPLVPEKKKQNEPERSDQT